MCIDIKISSSLWPILFCYHTYYVLSPAINNRKSMRCCGIASCLNIWMSIPRAIVSHAFFPGRPEPGTYGFYALSVCSNSDKLNGRTTFSPSRRFFFHLARPSGSCSLDRVVAWEHPFVLLWVHLHFLFIR